MTNADVAAGIEAATQPPSNIEKWQERRDSCPLAPLGHLDGRFWFITPAGELRVIEGRHLARELPALLCGDLKWLWDQFPRTTVKGDLIGFHADDAAAWLMRECSRAGLWNRNRPIGGPGVWADNGKPLVCCTHPTLPPAYGTRREFRLSGWRRLGICPVRGPLRGRRRCARRRRL